MNKVGDSSISPYLLQRLRSLEEATVEREQRRREPAPQQPPAQPENKTESPDKPAGVDKKI